MEKYIIITDSASDLPEEFVNENNLLVLPLQFHFNEESYNDYPDAREMSLDSYFDRLRQGEFSKTSQVNSNQYLKAYMNILEDGKDILVITLSSALSGTYNSALVAKQEALEKYPDRKIMIIDSKSGSLGQGLIVKEAFKLKKENLSLDEVYNKLDKFVYHVGHAFTFDSLKFLKAGGRIGSIVYHVGSTLRIRPIISADDDGKLKLRTNAFGRRRSLNAVIKRVVSGYEKKHGNTIYITHGDCLEEAETVKKAIEEQTNAKVKIYMMGPVIGSHGGPGTIAVFYPATKR